MSVLSDKIKVMREIAFVNSDSVQVVLKDFYSKIDTNENALKECYEVDKEGTNRKEPLIIKRMLIGLFYL